MTKQFFPICSMIFICITSIFSVVSIVAGLWLDRYTLLGIGFATTIITVSFIRDHKREVPRKQIAISLKSFDRVKDTIEDLNMNVTIKQDGAWVVIKYAESENERLMRLLFKNQIKVH